LVCFDGGVWFDAVLSKESESDGSWGPSAQELQKRLRELKDISETGGPSPFYCIMAMDGDRMGRMLSKNVGKEGPISTALAEFTAEVQKLQGGEDFAGRVVYAGGDDVLALVPMNRALGHARKLRKAYVRAFDRQGFCATVSAGLVFAHYNTPLQTLISDSHRLLDEIAKDGMDRDAFAVRVWKRGGPVLTFARKWHDDKSDVDWVERLAEMTQNLDEGVYSNRFFYRAPQLLMKLRGDKESLLDREEQVDLLSMQYLRQREGTNTVSGEERVRCHMNKLLDLITWPEQVKGRLSHLAGQVTDDGTLLVRFLAQKGVGV
jgi:CRISPR-associated protein Cmr2